MFEEIILFVLIKSYQNCLKCLFVIFIFKYRFLLYLDIVIYIYI